MNLHSLLATMVLTVAMTPLAHGENTNACTGLEANLSQPRGDLPPNVLKRIRAMARNMETLSVPMGMSCSDLGKVLSRLINGSSPGGKKLYDIGPLDVPAAQAEFQQAQQDPDLKMQLDGLRGTVADDQERLLYEAALLQSNSLYGARDLLLQQFMTRAKGE